MLPQYMKDIAVIAKRNMPPFVDPSELPSADLPETILLVDDDEGILNLVRMHLEKRGVQVTVARNGKQALEHFQKQNPDLILLDLMMPKVDGLQVCRTVRANARTPIIVISAIGLEEQKVEALDLGADDYLVKPFGVKELMARVRAVIRRSSEHATPRETLVRIGGLFSDLESGSLILEGERVHLTPTEFKLLAEFLKNRDQILTHEHLLRKVWGRSYTDSVEYLHMYIGRLRKKLSVYPDIEIETHVGKGYSLHIEQE
jgi:two-component system KDP operon response regulator KdpE